MSATLGGLFAVPAVAAALPISSPVREYFGRHCTELDEMFASVATTREQLALAELMAAHLCAQITLLRLALDSALSER